MSTKIEWCEDKSIIPMLINVTFSTCSTNIKQVGVAIPQMVMILFCRVSTIKARTTSWFDQSVLFNGKTNGIDSFLLLFLRCIKNLTLNFLFYPAALMAYSTKSITSFDVFIKFCRKFPTFTLPTPFEIFGFFKIFLVRNANSFCCYFLNAKYRSHLFLLNNSMGIIIPIRGYYVKN